MVIKEALYWGGEKGKERKWSTRSGGGEKTTTRGQVLASLALPKKKMALFSFLREGEGRKTDNEIATVGGKDCAPSSSGPGGGRGEAGRKRRRDNRRPSCCWMTKRKGACCNIFPSKEDEKRKGLLLLKKEKV